MSPARAGTSALAAVLAAAGLLLVLVTWAASIGPDRVLDDPGDDPSALAVTSATQSPTAEPGTVDDDHPIVTGTPAPTPSWVRVVALVLELLTLGVVVFLLQRLGLRLRQRWRIRSRRRAGPPVAAFDTISPAAAVTEAIAQDAVEQRAVLVGGEPRNAIVACWHRFEQQAMAAGLSRRRWETTGEFVLGVLGQVGADGGAVSRLADLYREARFSDHPISDADRTAALEALDAIHASLRGVRAGRGAS